MLSAKGAMQARMHKKWAVAAIKEVHHARFLLQPSALELFLVDRSNALLNFASNKVGGCSSLVAQYMAVIVMMRSMISFLAVLRIWQPAWEVPQWFSFPPVLLLGSLTWLAYHLRT